MTCPELYRVVYIATVVAAVLWGHTLLGLDAAPEPLSNGVLLPAALRRQLREAEQRDGGGGGNGGGGGGDLPSWVDLGELETAWQADHEANVAAVEALSDRKAARRQRGQGTAAAAAGGGGAGALEASGEGAAQELDLVLYGDSMTQYHRENPEPWQAAFGDLWVGWVVVVVVVVALWRRIVEGGEAPEAPPRVAAFLIGVNNVYKGLEPPAERLGWLLGWANETWPDTQLAVMALLPTTWADVGPTNDEYAELAVRRGIPFVDCSDLLDPTDPSQFGDGIHPVAKGQALVTSCLRAALAPWLGEQPGAAGG
ncbi:hypothetical protein C2E20_2453 [Micractinium conductrix]|uniref:SGNH hydrolase-type esterase domain-containing protein n=1 Tax=Micractinium conductrix TaxID=554055 RepID=A0A2P6VKR4_9CHLO|nr:hypothetical protein C2E20_2453 [Micractinium conductrix]|eukprot:PSC74692.1 hypothetical protein C2E20_2453 [Micractinium conductrix]